MPKNEIPIWLYQGRAKGYKKMLPNGPEWRSYLASRSKSYRTISISCILMYITFDALKIKPNTEVMHY
jgi:hypothetical protein